MLVTAIESTVNFGLKKRVSHCQTVCASICTTTRHRVLFSKCLAFSKDEDLLSPWLTDVLNEMYLPLV